VCAGIRFIRLTGATDIRSKMDARHFSTADLEAGLPHGADPEGVSIVFLVQRSPESRAGRLDQPAGSQAVTRPIGVRVLCPGVTGLPELAKSAGSADHVAGSLVQAIEICMSWRETRDQLDPPPPRSGLKEVPQAGRALDVGDRS
jgi:hypothetical protein